MIQLWSSSAFATNKKLKELIRLSTQFYIIRSLFSVPFPRQVIFFRILVAVSLADYGAIILWTPVILTRAYVLYTQGLPLQRKIGLLKGYIEAYFILILFFLLIEIAYRIGFRLDRRVIIAGGILILYLSYQMTIVDSGLYDKKAMIYEDLKETAKKLKRLLGSGGILSGITPGYIEAYLLPDFRVYQIFRIYEYPIVGELLKNDSIEDLIYYLKALEIKAFVYPSQYYFKRIYEKTQYFLESDYLLSLLLDSDAFRYAHSYSLYYLIASDLDKDFFFSRAIIFKSGYTYEIFGNGFSKVYPFLQGINSATFISKHKIIRATVYVTLEAVEEITLKIGAVIEERGDVYIIKRSIPTLEFEISQIRIELKTLDGEIKNYYF